VSSEREPPSKTTTRHTGYLNGFSLQTTRPCILIDSPQMDIFKPLVTQPAWLWGRHRLGRPIDRAAAVGSGRVGSADAGTLRPHLARSVPGRGVLGKLCPHGKSMVRYTKRSIQAKSLGDREIFANAKSSYSVKEPFNAKFVRRLAGPNVVAIQSVGTQETFPG
jgi:hypothetical protein